MARDFNGTTDRIDYTGPSSLTGSDLTVSAWVYPDAVTTTLRYIWCNHDSGNAVFGILFGLNPTAGGLGSGSTQLTRNGATALSRGVNSGDAACLTTGSWQHMLATATGSADTGIHIYRNGTEAAAYTTIAGPLATETTHSGSWSVGGRIYDDARNWDGRIGEVGVWNVVLDAGERAALAAGVSPLAIRPASLIFYAPLVRSQQEIKTGAAGTLDGTTVIEHPRVLAAVRGSRVGKGSATAYTLTAGSGSFTITGTAASLIAPHRVVADAGSYALTGTAATLRVGRRLAAGAGSYALTGTAATLTYAPVTSYTLTADPGAFAITGTAATLPSIEVDDSFEGSSVNVSGSSVSGVGDSATVTLKPRVQESEVVSSETRWLAPKARVNRVTSARPTFILSDYGSGAGKYHGHPWDTGRRMYYSYDQVTWTAFDTAHTIGASTITFRNSTAFTSSPVFIAWTRMVTPAMVGAWITGLAASYPTLIHETPSSSSYIAGTFATQTDELGRTIPAQPFYAFKISDASLSAPAGQTKRTLVLESGVHAGEDNGNLVLQRAVEFLLSSDTRAQNVRSHFDVFVYPMMNAPGRAGGGWRGSFTNGGSGQDDANRHFSDGSPGIEIVTLPRGVIVADLASIRGGVVQFEISFHGQYADKYGYYDDGVTPHAQWDAAIEVYIGAGQDIDVGSSNAGFVSKYFNGTKHTNFYITSETGEPTPLSDAQLTTWGNAHIQAISDLVDAGNVPVAYSLTADSGSCAVSGTAATLRSSHVPLSAGAGSIAITGTSATLSAARRLAAGSGSFGVTGTAAALVKTGNTVLLADPGACVLTGTATGLRGDRRLGASGASYSLAGSDVAFLRALVLVADSGTYAVTGTAATLTAPSGAEPRIRLAASYRRAIQIAAEGR